MGNRRVSLQVLLLLCLDIAAAGQSLAQTRNSGRPPIPSLSANEIARNLQQRDAQRAASLERFSNTRIYRMHYQGFPKALDAEMIVDMSFHAPGTKKFTIVSQSGSRFIIDRIFKPLLENEQEASDEENRLRSALTTANYDFTLAGYEPTANGAQYVLNLTPRTKNKFLYRGKIWVDANDFAVVRIQAEPARNPSMWIKQTEIQHTYAKVGDFWLPAENHTESAIRLGGRATLSIEYKNYRITKTAPPREHQTAREASQ